MDAARLRGQRMEQLMRKSLILAFAAAACALAAGAAQARTNVFWSIGINAAPIGVAVSNGPVYVPAPVYVEPAPVYVEPAPVYVPAPVVYAPPRVVYRPVPVVVGPRYYGPSPVVYGGGYGRYWDARARVWRHHDHDGWRDGRHDEYGDHYRGGWQPVPGDHRRYPH
jgi:hypothetical protein